MTRHWRLSVRTDTYNYDRQKAILRLTERCTNLSSEGLDIEEYITDDTQKVDILAEMSNDGLVIQKDRNWYATTSKD